jgi:uncharacterized protein (DUF58 family)
LVVPRLARLEGFDFGTPGAGLGGTQHSAERRGEADIAGVRPYRSGDPLKHLHVRTWARTGEPHVREYVDEQDSRVVLAVLVNAPRSTEAEQEGALGVAAGVALELCLRGPGLDILALDEHVVPIFPRIGQGALDQLLDRLAQHRLTLDQENPEAFLDQVTRGASRVVLVSCGPGQRLDVVVPQIRQRNVPCTWLHVATDPSQTRLSAGQVVPLEDVENERPIFVC